MLDIKTIVISSKTKEVFVEYDDGEADIYKEIELVELAFSQRPPSGFIGERVVVEEVVIRLVKRG